MEENNEITRKPGIDIEHTENPFRKLLEFKFQRPLCAQIHEASYHYSQESPSLEEFAEGLHAFAQDWKNVQVVLHDAVITIHSKAGDLERLAERADCEGMHETSSPTYRIVDESRYTCDGCGAAFETIHLLREHVQEHISERLK